MGHFLNNGVIFNNCLEIRGAMGAFGSLYMRVCILACLNEFPLSSYTKSSILSTMNFSKKYAMTFDVACSFKGLGSSTDLEKLLLKLNG